MAWDRTSTSWGSPNTTARNSPAPPQGWDEWTRQFKAMNGQGVYDYFNSGGGDVSGDPRKLIAAREQYAASAPTDYENQFRQSRGMDLRKQGEFGQEYTPESSMGVASLAGYPGFERQGYDMDAAAVRGQNQWFNTIGNALANPGSISQDQALAYGLGPNWVANNAGPVGSGTGAAMTQTSSAGLGGAMQPYPFPPFGSIPPVEPPGTGAMTQTSSTGLGGAMQPYPFPPFGSIPPVTPPGSLNGGFGGQGAPPGPLPTPVITNPNAPMGTDQYGNPWDTGMTSDADPYGTGIAQPHVIRDTNNPAYGADNELTLEDMGTPEFEENATDEDRFYLAGLGLNYNPFDQSAIDVYNNWAAAFGEDPYVDPSGRARPGSLGLQGLVGIG